MSAVAMFAMQATGTVAEVFLPDYITNTEKEIKVRCRITGNVEKRTIQVETITKESFWITLDKIIQLYPNRKPEYMIGYQVLVKPDNLNHPYWIIIAEIIDIKDYYSHYTYKFIDLDSGIIYDQELLEHVYVEIVGVFNKTHNDEQDINRLMKQMST